jgi:hypothetical protein
MNNTDTDEDDYPDALVPIPGGPRFDLLIPSADLVDDLVDSLWRNGSAQDYPAPEPEYPARLQVKHLDERRWSHYHEYTDQRSLTRDLKLDEPPVPGYRDFPQHIAQKLNFGTATMPSKSPKQARLMATSKIWKEAPEDWDWSAELEASRRVVRESLGVEMEILPAIRSADWAAQQAAHNPAFAKRAEIPVKVARKFNQADAKAGTLKAKKAGK